MVVRSLYLAVKLEVIDTGFARGMSDRDTDKLADEATESTLKLVEDLDLRTKTKKISR